MDKSPLALIGAGKWGQNYLKTIAAAEDLSLAAVVSSKSRNALNIGQQTQIFNGLDDFCSDTPRNLAGIIVATPPYVHYEQIEQLIRLKIPLLVEKPLTLDHAQAQKILTLANQQQVSITENFIHLFNSAFIALRTMLNQSDKFEITSHGEGHGPFRDYSPWYDYAPHDIAMVLTLIRQAPIKIEIVSLEAQGPLAYKIQVRMEFANDNIANIILGNTAENKIRLLMIRSGNHQYTLDDLAPSDKLKVNHQAIEYAAYGTPLLNSVHHLTGKIKIYDPNFMNWLSRTTADILFDVAQKITRHYPDIIPVSQPTHFI